MSASDRRYLVYQIRGRYCAVDLAVICEVMELPQLYPIPRAPGHFAGAMNFHGAIVPVLDLGVFLKGGSSSGGGKVLVLDEAHGRLAFLVDRVVTLAGADMICEVRASDAEDFAEETLLLEYGEIPILAVKQLLESLQMSMNK